MTDDQLFGDDLRPSRSTPTGTVGGRGGRGSSSEPLASRMRPRTLEEYVGHAAHVGPTSPLGRMLARGELSSLLLWAPPGTGKTSLARVIAQHVDAAFVELSAVTAGVKDVRGVIAEAESRRQVADRATILFLDEIHRFNKAQQDALLPAVESGVLTLIGATTENPFFELNAPLLSRCQLVRLEPLGEDDIERIIRHAIDDERGLANRFSVTDDAVEVLVAMADGDARTGLNALEVAVSVVADDGVVTVDNVMKAGDRRLRYDRGDAHYDQISAFIKSMRGSDPDATVYWLMRMLDAGEDPRFLARRIVIAASEDVGLASSDVLGTVVAAAQALDRVGLPEATFHLTHAALAVALAPKSNSVGRAMGAARALIERTGNAPVPTHLRDAHSKAGRTLGHGAGYDYPHDHPGGKVAQDYLPDGLTKQRLYEPSGNGDERSNDNGATT